MTRSVFITGGGSGLGAATARHLAKLGWRCALAGRKGERLSVLAAQIKGAKTYALDVSDAAAVDHAIRDFAPDALVNCAGMLGRGEVWELKSDDFARVLQVNVLGTYNACASAMRLWRERKREGDIVNVSSLGGIRGLQKFSGFSAYASSKHAVVGLTEALALDGKSAGIRVNCVAPGTMRTDMTEALGLTPKTQPDSVAPTIAFLLDRTLSGPITGTTVEVHCNDD